jgi:hypothetical protein
MRDSIATPSLRTHTHAHAGGFNPQFFPKLEGIAALFSRPATAASWALHILAINLFLGRAIYLDGAWAYFFI